MRQWARVVLLGAVCVLIAVASGAGTRADLSVVGTWAIQLQDVDLAAIAAADLDVVVIDYSADGSAAGEYAASEIASLKASGKTVLAYFSIGEAEDYRFYWKSSWATNPPAWLGEENPDWPGNYKVKYWTSGWWNKALGPYLDRILAAGFDGVYLDLIDSYWYWGSDQDLGVKRSANRMAKLVEKIALYARAANGEQFIIVPQNGISIIDDSSSSWRTRYLAAADAFGAESLFYDIWSGADQAYRLGLFAEAGKKVFNIEYIGPDEYGDYAAILADQTIDIVGYAADPDRALDELVLPD
jgi:cysteinyl-tRNA synthetase